MPSNQPEKKAAWTDLTSSRSCTGFWHSYSKPSREVYKCQKPSATPCWSGKRMRRKVRSELKSHLTTGFRYLSSIAPVCFSIPMSAASICINRYQIRIFEMESTTHDIPDTREYAQGKNHEGQVTLQPRKSLGYMFSTFFGRYCLLEFPLCIWFTNHIFQACLEDAAKVTYRAIPCTSVLRERLGNPHRRPTA